MGQKSGKFLRKVAVMLLWLAVTIIMAHTVIPHDHHSEYSGSVPDASCNAAANEEHHHLPLHCHAFNDLVCEKYTFQFFKLHNSSTSYLPLCAHLVSVTIFRTQQWVTTYALKFPLISSELSASDPFRAPPMVI
jgi:hypothetical protein